MGVISLIPIFELPYNFQLVEKMPCVVYLKSADRDGKVGEGDGYRPHRCRGT